jgi:hypothetical protein
MLAKLKGFTTVDTLYLNMLSNLVVKEKLVTVFECNVCKYEWTFKKYTRDTHLYIAPNANLQHGIGEAILRLQ